MITTFNEKRKTVVNAIGIIPVIVILTILSIKPAFSGDDGVEITESKWEREDSRLITKGKSSFRGGKIIIKDFLSDVQLGETKTDKEGKWGLKLENPEEAPCAVVAQIEEYKDIRLVKDAPGCDLKKDDLENWSADQDAAKGDLKSPPPSTVGLTGSHAGRFSTYEGSATCIECHEREAIEVHSSVHYQWKGDARNTIGLDDAEAGKLGGINDFCIYPDINWIGKMTNLDGIEVDGGCAKCHVGLGEKPSSVPSADQLANIDCLVCHSREYKRKVEMVNGQYRFTPAPEKMTTSVLQAAVNITEPTRDNCLNCHTKSGGGNNYKRGDIEEAHRNPTLDFDFHMASKAEGGAGLNCIDCHSVANHRFEGRGTDLRPMDSFNELDCTKCHVDKPHDKSDLNRHTARVNCTVCHIPVFAKDAPTDMERNWDLPGEVDQVKRLYDPHNIKVSRVMPEYQFYNGKSHFYEFGDQAIPGESGRIVMSAPDGSIQDKGAKIYAFKHHFATQPIDPETERLLPLKIGIFFQTGDIDSAVKVGAQSVGWEISKGYTFAKTERYMGLFHEVAPKEQALNCNSCHNGGDRLDFDALGYQRKTVHNNRPLCASCHGDKSDEWRSSEFFGKVHRKHVDDKKYDCSACHEFSSAN